MAISLYCALVAPDFRHGVILAVNHDGDSDSTGSITGNLPGTQHGLDVIPQQWLEPLELREVIAKVASDLLDRQGSSTGNDAKTQVPRDRIWRKYAGCSHSLKSLRLRNGRNNSCPGTA